MYICGKITYYATDESDTRASDKRKDLYFGSIAAIYTVLTAEEVGAGYDYMRRAGLSGGGTVVTKKAIIKQSTLITSPRGGSHGSDD